MVMLETQPRSIFTGKLMSTNSQVRKKLLEFQKQALTMDDRLTV